MEARGCFDCGSVIRDLESRDKYTAIHELICKAPVFRRIDDVDYLEQAVVKREKIQSTGLGNGVAVAHGKCAAVESLVMALGISRDGIEFESMDGQPVRFLFVVANPPGMQLEYLLALSVLVRVIRDERFRDELLLCRDSEEIEGKMSRAFRASMIRRGFPVN